MRTFGVEEEFLLVDPSTGRPASSAPLVLREVDADGALDLELLQHQLETRTEPCTDLDDARVQLADARRALGSAARDVGLAVVATGTSPFRVEDVSVTPKDRYREMVDEYGEIGRRAGTCGMHVHIGIESRDEGVGILDRLRPWLPVVLALSVNSPYADGTDTGYASWRSQVWSRWPTAGPTEVFGDPATYDAVAGELQSTGAARDPGMVYFDARLAHAQPTVEVRVCDVCATPDDAVVVAAVVRALASTAAAAWAAGEPPPSWRVETLRAAAWRASRYGLAGRLVDPLGRGPQPARDVLAGLVEHVRPALDDAGDLAAVSSGFERLLAATGAVRQRAAFERSGSIEGVVADLVSRSEAVWQPA